MFKLYINIFLIIVHSATNRLNWEIAICDTFLSNDRKNLVNVISVLVRNFFECLLDLIRIIVSFHW